MMLLVQTSHAQVVQKPSGAGLEHDPYKVSSLEHLCWISENPESWSSYFVQTASINASNTKFWNEADHDNNPKTKVRPMGFSPIGKNALQDFTGSYNGQNHVIENLYINRPIQNNVGLFGYVQTYSHKKSIRNVRLVNVKITGKTNVGGLMGFNNHTRVEHCFVSGNVQGEQSLCGGLIGEMTYHASVSGSTFHGTVTGWGDHIGGLVGKCKKSVIERSTAKGGVSGYGNNVGGLIGLADNSEIKLNYTNAKVSAKGGHTGGLLGYMKRSTLNNSYSTGALSGSWIVGGAVGYAADSRISNIYAALKTEGQAHVGGFIGVFNNSNIQHSFWDMDISGQLFSNSGQGKNTREMLSKNGFTDWDFTNIWKINPNVSYPGFIWQNQLPKPTHSNDSENNLFVDLK